MAQTPKVRPDMVANNIKTDFAFHPGEIIMDELEYLKISQKAFADQIGVSCSLVNQILKGKRSVSVEFALLTEAALGIPSQMLLKMQKQLFGMDQWVYSKTQHLQLVHLQ